MYSLTNLVLVDGNCNEGDLQQSSMNISILQICSEGMWKYICAKSVSYHWSENEARVACYQMRMSWEKGSGIVAVLIFLIIWYIIYSDTELTTNWTDQNTLYLKNMSCSGIEEKLIHCSSDVNYYCDYYTVQGYHYFKYATAKCIEGILCILYIINFLNYYS